MDATQQNNDKWDLEECRGPTDEIWSTWAVALKYGLALEGLYGYRAGSVLDAGWWEGAAERPVAL